MDPSSMRMLDLFSGSGSASRAAAVRGWDVFRIDVAPGTAADLHADLGAWEPPPGARFDLVWASPPCTQLSTASTKRDVEAGLVLVRAAIRIIRELRPRWWVLENVHGATQAIGELLGPPVARYGSFYLWGVFPPFVASVARTKTKLSGRRRAERRAAIPWAISEGLVRACEQLAAELGARAGAGGGSSGASSGDVEGQADAGAGAGGGSNGASSGAARGTSHAKRGPLMDTSWPHCEHADCAEYSFASLVWPGRGRIHYCTVREDQILDLIREEELWLERQPFLQALASGAFAPYQVKR